MKNKKWLMISLGAALLIALGIGIVSLVKGYFILAPSVQILPQGDEVQVVAAHSDYTAPKVTARKGNVDLTHLLTVGGSVDTAVLGDHTITYTLTYEGKTYTAQQIVRVQDLDAPVLQLTGNAEMIVSARSLYREPGYTAQDNCDGDVTDQVSVTYAQKDDVLTVTYTVLDAAGNAAQLHRVVTLRDIVPPTVTLAGRDTVYIRCGRSFTDPGATAADDLDGDVTGKITHNGSVNADTVGTYTVTYEAADAAGNTGSASRKVIVYEPYSSAVGTVYLTFDDGPSYLTGEVLDVLAANGVKATFFILDYSAGHRWLIQRMINEGHTVGIHGYSHDYATIYANDEAFMQNIYLLRDKLLADFGYNATAIRFPGGSSNGISRAYNEGIMTRLAQRVQQEGFRYFDWTLSSGDAAGSVVPTDTIYSNVTQGLQHGTNMVLMHDAYGKDTTAEALQDIIDYAYGNGYTFRAIDASTPDIHHGILN